MDEVGMLVRGILEDGTLAYDAKGIDPRCVVGKRVRVGESGLPGVIGAKAIHMQTEEEFASVWEHRALYVDIGAKDKADAEANAAVGDFICFDTRFMRLGALLSGKALDDRIGCAILMQLLQNTYACDFYAAFTVQEELGLRGAITAAYAVRPQLALVLEATTANDLPGLRPDESVTRVGGGAAITMMDGVTMALPRMFFALKAAAEQNGIPYQVRQGTRGGTDGGSIHTALAGCPVGGISVPCRYIHSPCGVASGEDIQAAYALAHAFLKEERFHEVLRHV
jgi:endoglucanase